MNCAISVVIRGEDGISIYMKMRWRDTSQRLHKGDCARAALEMYISC